MKIVPWPERGCFALLLDFRLVTAGSFAYCKAVMQSARERAIQAATREEAWEP